MVPAIWAGGVAVWFQEAAVSEHPRHHAQGAKQEGRATASAVDEEESRDGEDDLEDVLDARGGEEVVT